LKNIVFFISLSGGYGKGWSGLISIVNDEAFGSFLTAFHGVQRSIMTSSHSLISCCFIFLPIKARTSSSL
jgi:hypothetical protein